MRAKLLFNTLYTIGIVLCAFTLMWGFQHGRYEIITGALVVGGMFIYLKIKLLREVRSSLNTKNKPQKP